MKTLHKYLLKAYLPPFFLTLFVAVFIFFLIFVFTYMDDIIGKGLDTWVLIQFFVYSWITFIPQSIPLAVLLSSIMTFGNLSENYELAAMKSSGLSLFRIMRPVLAFIFVLGGITFLFTNYTLPFVTLKSSALLWDIRESKPALNIKEGIFYSQLDGYSMRVGHKDDDGHTIYDVMIYDHTAGMGNSVQTYADKGYMATTADTGFLAIQLFDGNRYDEVVQEERQRRTRPLMQMHFQSLEVHLDLKNFKMKRTDEDLFKDHHEMMNVWQISHQIDTFKIERANRYANLGKQADTYFFNRTMRTVKRTAGPEARTVSVKEFYAKLNNVDFARCVENAQNLARSNSSFIDSVIEEGKQFDTSITEYNVGWHKKINVSFACIVLFFVGAPLGAIIRKGGLGMPVVVAVFFFLVYYVVSITYERLVLKGVYTEVFGMWFPLLIFLPLGFFLTYKAATDSVLFDISLYFAPFKKLAKIFKKKED